MPANVLAAQVADNPEMKVHLSSTAVLSALQKKLDHMQKVMLVISDFFIQSLLSFARYISLLMCVCVWMCFDVLMKAWNKLIT